MPGFYFISCRRKRLCGERSGKTFSLGDKLKILVARVDLDQKRIDFELISTVKGNSKKIAPSETPTKKAKKKAAKTKVL